MTDRPTMHDSTGTRMEEALRWALETAQDPAMAAADWLVRDLGTGHDTALALLMDHRTPLADLIRAKLAFKTMRLVGETANDRRLAARLYAISIAAALVRYGRRISEQSSEALGRALASIETDDDLPESLRNLAALGLAALRAGKETADERR